MGYNMGLGLFNISNYDRNMPIMVKMRGQSTSDDLPLAIYDIFLIFIDILSSFKPEWLFQKVIMGLGLFNISNYNRNVPILVKMMGQRIFDDLPLVRYDIFLILLRFQPVF